ADRRVLDQRGPRPGRGARVRSLTAAALAGAAIVVTAQSPWTPQLTGAGARLRGISAVSDRVAWASGTGGTVLRTTNGGDTWTSVGVPNAAELDFRDVDAFSE